MNLRQKKLLNILIKENNYLKAKYLAAYLNVSQRTVHSDLETIATKIATNDIEIIRKPGIGVKLQAIPHQKQTLLVNYDLTSENTNMLSTTPLENQQFPVMIVSSFISQYDINAINEYMISNYKSLDNLTLSSLANVTNRRLIFSALNCASKEEALGFITQELYRNGYVKEEYAQSVVDRENILSTDIGKLIAIPHGKCDYILKNTIAIAALKEPIIWNKNPVSLTFMIVMNMDNPLETKAVLNDLYKVIDSQELINVFINDLDYVYSSFLNRVGESK